MQDQAAPNLATWDWMTALEGAAATDLAGSLRDRRGLSREHPLAHGQAQATQGASSWMQIAASAAAFAI